MFIAVIFENILPVGNLLTEHCRKVEEDISIMKTNLIKVPWSIRVWRVYICKRWGGGAGASLSHWYSLGGLLWYLYFFIVSLHL